MTTQVWGAESIENIDHPTALPAGITIVAEWSPSIEVLATGLEENAEYRLEIRFIALPSGFCGADELVCYEARARDLQAKWGMEESQARRKAYAEMIRRYLPEGHPVLRYYYSDSISQ